MCGVFVNARVCERGCDGGMGFSERVCTWEGRGSTCAHVEAFFDRIVR